MSGSSALTGNRIIDRRRLLKGALAGVTAPAIIIPGRAAASGRRLVVVNFGGIMGQAKQSLLYTPFTRETGIEIVAVPGPDIAKLKLQVQTRNLEWDVMDLLPGWLPLAIRQGLLEPIDETVVHRSGCLPQARSDHAVGYAIATSGIAFASDRFTARPPRDWREFWDVTAFPGRRGLNRRIPETLEIALLADGVPAAEIYPCDVERAFRSLDRIKPHISHWIAHTEQTVSLIQQNEADFTYAFSTRVKNMREAGAQIGFSKRQDLFNVSWTGVVKGTPNKDAAMRLCAYVADPERQIALSNVTGDAPVYLSAMQRVAPATRVWLPRLEDPQCLFVNAQWWDNKLEALTLRFQDWLFS